MKAEHVVERLIEVRQTRMCRADMPVDRCGPNRRRQARRRGFTLIELLVVVAVIALLISILIPSLSAARERARGVVCMSHMNQVAKARAYYCSEYDGWLAGPHTSGHELTHIGDPGEARITEDLVTSGTAPVQNMDWASPTLGMIMTLQKRDISRLVQLLNTKLRCPSNKEFYDGVYDPDNPDVQTVAGVDVHSIRYASYVAIEGFHLIGDRKAVGDGRDVTAKKAEVEMPNITQGLVDFPDDYYPKEDRVGSPASKVYVLEGARYVEENAPPTFNTMPFQDEGGNFMALGPAVGNGGDPTVLPERMATTKLSEMNKRYAWRHREGMNMVFFDGHCEHRDWRKTLDISLYFPSRTIVKATWRAQDPNAQTNMEIP